MHLHGNGRADRRRSVTEVRSMTVVLIAMMPVCAHAQSGWQQMLSSGNLSGDPRIHLTGTGARAGGDWKARVEKGAVLILEGDSPLAVSLGFRPSSLAVTVTSLRDVHEPDMRIVLEKPIELSRWD